MTRDAELERLRPSEGARFMLERDGGGDAATVEYRAWVLTPSAIHAYAATLGDDGTATLTALGDAAPDELAAMLDTIARLTARAASKKRSDGLQAWPHRVLRWRGPGRAASNQSSSSS